MRLTQGGGGTPRALMVRGDRRTGRGGGGGGGEGGRQISIFLSCGARSLEDRGIA